MVSRRWCLTTAGALFAVALPLASMQAERERKIYKIGGEVSAPRLLEKREPNYTQEARDAKIEGSVLLAVIIDVDGRIHEALVKRSLDPGLDRNAVEAVKTWRFEPAQKAGEPVAVSANVEVNFRLL